MCENTGTQMFAWQKAKVCEVLASSKFQHIKHSHSRLKSPNFPLTFSHIPRTILKSISWIDWFRWIPLTSRPWPTCVPPASTPKTVEPLAFHPGGQPVPWGKRSGIDVENPSHGFPGEKDQWPDFHIDGRVYRRIILSSREIWTKFKPSTRDEQRA